MLATETMKPGPFRPSRGSDEQRLIVIVAQPDFLVECLAEVLRRRFPGHDVLVDDEPPFLRDEESRIRLVLFYHQDSAEIAALLGGEEARNPAVSVGVLIDDPGGLDHTLKLMAEEQRIDGILPLDMRLDVFLAGVELLMKGGEHFPSALLRRLNVTDAAPGAVAGLARVAQIAEPDAIAVLNGHDSRLTTREVEILDLLCKGTQNKIIAHRLKLSENTVKAHVRNIYKKLRVTNRTEAAMRFFDGALGDAGKTPTGQN
jgi:DNA-binding NarL/FixJ family response regulator